MQRAAVNLCRNLGYGASRQSNRAPGAAAGRPHARELPSVPAELLLPGRRRTAPPALSLAPRTYPTPTPTPNAAQSRRARS
eukprot:scaffold13054_cov21-Phaeocystis_antarctica.AAC.1